MTEIRAVELSSPVGPIVVMATDEGICHLSFGRYDAQRDKLEQWAGRAFEDLNELPALVPSGDHPLLHEASQQLDAYFAKRLHRFDLPLHMSGTPFQLKVWEALRQIPYGETCSYKDIALKIYQPGAMRAVGGANNRNPVSVIVPCHRVIGASGKMVGYGGGLPIKLALLDLEQLQ
ncbi:methylated-DNA--[protein]-cysteine S-methyltransferase [Paenibacillus sp. GCM10027627]|uniref:methylated-DNA--[protein]-cysteine S-methyltransferase n=1 Tax=unclassified Paenibacillus TaxID=185978 RepID=UPI0036274477